MKVLWICNIALPDVAAAMNQKASNKEGWLSGVCAKVSNEKEIELGICFPASEEHRGDKFEINGIKYFCFYENTAHPECYDPELEVQMERIYEDFSPDMVHSFGTEFPHSLAMAKCVKKHSGKLLVGIQGVVDECAKHYLDGVPMRVVKQKTFRDIIRKDNLSDQKRKFEARAAIEAKTLGLAEYATGRTEFDYEFCKRTNPDAVYFSMNETLRSAFYEKCDRTDVESHSIFLTQGNYPIKGFHYLIEAMPKILEKYPDTKLYVAGHTIIADKTIKDKIKISAYGLYLLNMIKKYHLQEKIISLGDMTEKQIRDRLAKTHIFVCPSTIENSPNSLGEAMLTGVPCVAAKVGGIPSIFEDDKDGILYEPGNIDAMVQAIDRIWSNEELAENYAKNAREHALRTHNGDTNYSRLMEIYKEIVR